MFCFNSNPIINTVVHHIDRNSLNNKSSNLNWVTPKENALERGPYPSSKLIKEIIALFKKRI